jgi:hypothetical protein
MSTVNRYFESCVAEKSEARAMNTYLDARFVTGAELFVDGWRGAGPGATVSIANRPLQYQ